MEAEVGTIAKSSGQIAFEAYNESKGGKTWDGKPIPPWGDVGDEVRNGWEAAAFAVVKNIASSTGVASFGSTESITGEAKPRVKVGSLVHYVLSSPLDKCREDAHGRHVPAVVVRVWNETRVNLQVLIDGLNDFDDGRTTLWVTSAMFGEINKERGTHDTQTWHWPE